jgi:gamma-glutamyltranspeptidase/glutathione hydrolase
MSVLPQHKVIMVRLFIITCIKAPLRSLLFLCLLSSSLQAATPPPAHAIASAHPLATQAGLQILQQGGNAFDAAVAVSTVLAVVEPYGSGMGGGGFWLLHRAQDNKQVMIDGREKAPLAAHRDMYLDEFGEPIPGLSITGPMSAGIPGQPAALVHIAEQYGVLPLTVSLAPAIKAARQGFPVDAYYQRMAGFRLPHLKRFPQTAKLFLQDNEVPAIGHIIQQKDLASTLQRIAEKGQAGFYQGEVAAKLVAGVREAGGIWTQADLDAYQVIEREPLVGEYQGYRVVSVPPPSSGGVVLLQSLKMLSHLPRTEPGSVQRIHQLVEVMRHAYEDRAHHLGDSDFVEVPIPRLLSDGYLKQRAQKNIRLGQAGVSKPMVVSTQEGKDTTHFSILDKAGNRVAATLSINYPFGSAFVVPGTGILLNDEMDDFSIKPGTPNAYGLVGNEANAIEPGKRMLSSMTPTFIESDSKVAILGTPGGSRIISMVLLGALEMMQGKPVDEWVKKPRFHHQYLPDVIQFEPDALTAGQQKQLQAMGHKLKPLKDSYGNMQAILWDKAKNAVSAASDPRGIGAQDVEGEPRE